ncbi:arginine deiminase family protein [Candidatus Aminicenantes bacterium AH-873-B07]|jgi:dimethylargininase|nr:arginine deiminase family protein [Candidatus Aminicenantes bacterium AH-873-B07]
MLRSEGERLRKVIVCTPEKEYFKVDNLRAHNIEEIADKEKAKTQHDELKRILRNFGSEIIDIPELQNHPNSIFTRDTAVCIPYGYIRLRMGLETRKGEEEWMSEILNSLGESLVGSIKDPGTVEGGDIILGGRVAFIGHSLRTNSQGVKQISEILKSMNYEIRAANLPKNYLHIGGAMTMIGPENILCCKNVFPEDFFKDFEITEIECPSSITSNVIYLGNQEVIADSSNYKAIEALERKGYKIHAIDLSEFVKGKGGPSCLILPIERKD